MEYVMNPRNIPRSWLPVEYVDVDDSDIYDEEEMYEVDREEDEDL
jgi:hypothetical protein